MLAYKFEHNPIRGIGGVAYRRLFVRMAVTPTLSGHKNPGDSWYKYREMLTGVKVQNLTISLFSVATNCATYQPVRLFTG